MADTWYTLITVNHCIIKTNEGKGFLGCLAFSHPSSGLFLLVYSSVIFQFNLKWLKQENSTPTRCAIIILTDYILYLHSDCLCYFQAIFHEVHVLSIKKGIHFILLLGCSSSWLLNACLISVTVLMACLAHLLKASILLNWDLRGTLHPIYSFQQSKHWKWKKHFSAPICFANAAFSNQEKSLTPHLHTHYTLWTMFLLKTSTNRTLITIYIFPILISHNCPIIIWEWMRIFFVLLQFELEHWIVAVGEESTEKVPGTSQVLNPSKGGQAV